MIIVTLIGILFLVIFLAMFGTFLVFRRFENLTAKAYARLTKTKYQKNVSFRVSPRRYSIAKHYTRSVYIFTVNGKSYKARCHDLQTPKQIPSSLKIVYIKKLPFLFYVNEEYYNGAEVYLLISMPFLLMAMILLITVLLA